MAEPKFLRIVNWDRFQHYRDRNPPWIKLYRDLLTSQTWVTLDDAGRVLAIACMMLAAATGNRIPFDSAYVRRVAYLNQDPDFSALLSLNFLDVFTEPASNMLATCQRVASTEGETETETETEGETEKTPSLKAVVVDFELPKKNADISQSQPDWTYERDLRELAKARKQVELRLSQGCEMRAETPLKEQCAIAGVTPERANEVWRWAESKGASA